MRSQSLSGAGGPAALNRSGRGAAAEEYVGEWLRNGVDQPRCRRRRSARRECVDAMLTVLETLNPPNGRCLCCERCSTCPTTRSRLSRRVPTPSVRSPTGHDVTSGPVGPDRGPTQRATPGGREIHHGGEIGRSLWIDGSAGPRRGDGHRQWRTGPGVRLPVEGAEKVATLLTGCEVRRVFAVSTVWLNGAAVRIDRDGSSTAVPVVADE